MVLQSGKKKSDFRINISRKEKKNYENEENGGCNAGSMMTVSLAACGQSGDNTKEASKKQTKETTKTTERPELSQKKTGRQCGKSLHSEQSSIIC